MPPPRRPVYRKFLPARQARFSAAVYIRRRRATFDGTFRPRPAHLSCRPRPARKSPPGHPADAPAAVHCPAPRGGKPAWMRHPLFRFGSSVKLAVVLISVLILASIAGTLYETSFDSRVARAYIYNAWWFNLWLVDPVPEPDLLGVLALAVETPSHRLPAHPPGHHRAARGRDDRPALGASRAR